MGSHAVPTGEAGKEARPEHRAGECSGLAVGCTVTVAGDLPRWWPTGAEVQALTPLGAFALICGAILAALMPGRAVGRGRLRRCFWLIEEPRWLTPE